MIQGNGFTAVSYFIFVSRGISGRIYTNFPVFTEWIISESKASKGYISLSAGNKKNNGIPCIASC